MIEPGTVVVAGLAAAVLVWRLVLLDRRGAHIGGRVEALRHEVVRWQAAHDHQVASMDRRMRDVEMAAARAEREARILSHQLVGSDGLARRVERLEAWVVHLAGREGRQ